MASQMLGRCACPECGFESAHVKKTEGKETAKAYRYCPECGAQYFPRSNRQENDLLAKMRTEGVKASKAPEAPEVSTEPEKAPEAPENKPEQSFKYVFGVKVPV
jgi:hypothetical protein